MPKKVIPPHEKFYIEQNPENLSVKELAKMFGRTEQTIRNMMPKKTKVEVKVEVPAVEKVEAEVKKVVQQNISNLMGRHSRNGQVVSTVMTPSASEAADDARRKNIRPLSETLKNSIHKPRG